MVVVSREGGLGSVPGVVHAFTGREGGVSRGPLASLNLARRAGELDEHLAVNWERAVAALHPGWGPERVALVDQVHGDGVVRVSAGAGPFAPLGAADALITDAPGVVLAVRVADCVPVLLAVGGVVAAIHAGWQGAAAGVVPRALQEALHLAGRGPEEVVAAIGPSVCGRCYEVGPEVVEALLASGASGFEVGRSERGRPLVDVGAAVADQLRSAGVSRIGRLSSCTVESPHLWSHRRDGAAAGRQAALIARLP